MLRDDKRPESRRGRASSNDPRSEDQETTPARATLTRRSDLCGLKCGGKTGGASIDNPTTEDEEGQRKEHEYQYPSRRDVDSPKRPTLAGDTWNFARASNMRKRRGSGSPHAMSARLGGSQGVEGVKKIKATESGLWDFTTKSGIAHGRKSEKKGVKKGAQKRTITDCQDFVRDLKLAREKCIKRKPRKPVKKDNAKKNKNKKEAIQELCREPF